MTIDWEEHRYSGVLCEFRPRRKYKERDPKRGMLKKAGTHLTLTAMWKMDDDDPYPGEYALGAPGLLDVLGVVWIASGDVVALHKQKD